MTDAALMLATSRTRRVEAIAMILRDLKSLTGIGIGCRRSLCAAGRLD